MVIVTPKLLDKFMEEVPLIRRGVEVLESDDEVMELLKLSNVFAVHRLKYNDHGPVHAKIVAGSALEIFNLLVGSGVKPTTVIDGTARNNEEAMLIILLASYLHDIGNAVHRDNHELIGMLMSKSILDRILPDILGEKSARLIGIRQEVLHAIYATSYDAQCLTMEAGTVKIADGTDMAEGRARMPYKLGKMDMHAVSALSIKYVDISRGKGRPVRITVQMDDLAGLFQIERVLTPKIKTSGLEEFIEVVVYSRGKELITYPS
ncbi:MAG TPA: HD domain-containing protein [Acidilobales archaeon]|nr:HD domain-containing protein [Acidilobales archaeon]